MKVELIYDSDCPNVNEAKESLIQGLVQAGISIKWREWDRSDPNSPKYVRSYGSPTILVNGRDAVDLKPSKEANCCRIYKDQKGEIKGAPSIEQIKSALLKAQKKGLLNKSGIVSFFAAIPVIGAAVLPSVTCPACWPAYAGLLSSLGIGFVNYTPFVMPLMAFFLVFALALFAYKAKNRRGYGPFILGIGAGLILFLNRLFVGFDFILYSSIALLVSASVWNNWPKQKIIKKSCCVSIALFFLSFSSLAYGEIEEVRIQVDGLSCPFCVYGVEQQLKEVPNIKEVLTDFKQGRVNLSFKEDKPLDLSTLYQAVERGGFTPVGAEIEAKGNLSRWKDQPALKIPETHQTFLLLPINDKSSLPKALERNDGREVTIRGKVHMHADLPPSLRVIEITSGERLK